MDIMAFKPVPIDAFYNTIFLYEMMLCWSEQIVLGDFISGGGLVR